MMVWTNVHIDIQLLAALCGTRLVKPISRELRVEAKMSSNGDPS